MLMFEKKHPAVIPYAPQKTSVDAGYEEPYFKRSRPEKHGVPSSLVAEYLRRIGSDKSLNVHSIMILKDGYVIGEASAPGYSVNTRHLSHSMSKSVTGMAIGMLIEENKLSLSDRLCDFFPEFTQPKRSKLMSITIEHLLTMSTGIAFAEVGSVTESDWSRAFMESGISFLPGTDFSYNSMNSYMLAAIATRVTGMSLCDYLEPRLFRPLGIKNYFWEKSPEGIEKGGWGLYMSAESWAKLGQLYLNGGVWEGKRIISEEWVTKSCTAHMTPPSDSGDYNYGYQMWVSRHGGEYLFNGMLGQNVWICPENGIVVSMNSGNGEFYQRSLALTLLHDMFGSGVRLQPAGSSGDYKLLQNTEKNFGCRTHWVRLPRKGGAGIFRYFSDNTHEAWKALCGNYTISRNNVGILPYFVRVMQNNHSEGIDEISFSYEGGSVFVTVREGKETYNIEAGIYEAKRNVIDFCGEPYIINASCEYMEDEERDPLFKFLFQFPEIPNERRIKVSFDGGRLKLRMSEMPNERIIRSYVDSITVSNPKMSSVASFLSSKVNNQMIINKLLRAFSPTLYSYVGEDDIAKLQDSKMGFISRLLRKRFAPDTAAIAERSATAAESESISTEEEAKRIEMIIKEHERDAAEMVEEPDIDEEEFRTFVDKESDIPKALVELDDKKEKPEKPEKTDVLSKIKKLLKSDRNKDKKQ